jgi:glycosyltransferase involved in cell wall biosynthesis
MKDRIIIEEEKALIQKTGIGQYTLMIESLAQALGQETEIFNKSFLKNIKNKYFGMMVYWLWLNTFFLFKISRQKGKVTVIGTNYHLPVMKPRHAKYIAVIHDIRIFLHPETISKSGGWLFKKIVKNAIKKSDYLIAVSNTVKQEIVDFFGYPEDKIFIVYNSIGFDLNMQTERNNVLSQLKIEPGHYILSVITQHKHKNAASLMKAFEKISKKYHDLKLVVVGAQGNARSLPDNENVIFTGYIPDEAVQALYRHASLFVFPSVYEGFGIPIIEAQKFQVPALCSDIPVFKEIAGDSAEFFTPTPEGISEKMEILLRDPARKEKLISRGLENIKRFHPDTVKKQLREILTT